MDERKSVDVDDLLRGRGLQSTARSGSTPLFNHSASGTLLDLCERVGVGVLGIEGFTLSDQGSCPDMDFIADCSALFRRHDFEAESVRSARKFLSLATGAPHLLFEFELASLETPSLTPK
jgi:hypothetical protein